MKIFLTLTLFIFLAADVQADMKSGAFLGKMKEYLRAKLMESDSPVKLTYKGEILFASVMLNKFYKNRDYLPAWTDEKGPIKEAEELIWAIKEAHKDGLTPEYYHLTEIETLYGKLTKTKAEEVPLQVHDLLDLDWLLTDAFLLLSCHFSSGCINPVRIEAQWFANRGSVDVSLVLAEALKKKRVKEALKDMQPHEDLYFNLKKSLTRYRKIVSNGGWAFVSAGRNLKKGDQGERVRELINRLITSGDLPDNINFTSSTFDSTVEMGVHTFQKRHGLKPDGIAGPETIRALNVSPEERTHQIELNLERLRWSFRDLGNRYIIVNIADFSLNLVEKGVPVLKMNVVVGKRFWHTPVFRSEMKYLVFNPSWNIPNSIAFKEIVPKIIKNINYLAEKSIKVFRGWGNDLKEIDPENIDWKNHTFTRRLRFSQEPSRKNPLGRVKFVFPNKFNVYLHDSPNRSLYSLAVRTFSHGCIRLEKPIELASYLLRGTPGWNRSRIDTIIRSGDKKTVKLSRPVNVHILYLTSWVDESGIINFRKDIYGRDRRLGKALEKLPYLPH